jgi:hypothetical protein
MTTFATLNDLLEQESNLQDYGLLDWSQELAKAQEEVIRHIRVRWYPMYLNETRSNIRHLSPSPVMDPELLDPTQWTQATLYYCIAHQVCPKLTKFEAQGDRFQIMMDYYAKRFDTEFEIILREGVRYDSNEDDVFQPVEKETTGDLRLKR